MEISGHAAVVTVTATPPEPYFKFDPSPQYPPKQFATRDDLKGWLLQEQLFFSFMNADPKWRQSGSPFNDVAPQADLHKPALDRLQLAENSASDPAAEASHLRKLGEHLRGSYVDNKCLMADDPRADFISRLWREGLPNPRVAAWTLVAFMGRSGNMNDPLVFEGATRAMLFKLGLSETAESARTTLTTLHGDYIARLEVLDARRRDLLAATDAATASATISAAQQLRDFDAAQTARTTESERIRKEAEDSFEQQRKAYNEHMALHAPVTYWSNKARRHAICGAIFGALSVIFLALYIWAAVDFLPSFIGMLRGVVEATTGAPAQGTAANASNVHSQAVPVYVALFAVALIGIWIMRIFVRLTLSHIHLGTDAKHRSVCVQSYLALLSMQKNAVGENERKIILTQLFRPTSDGLVRDDAMPPTLFERITSPR